ncbi:hypothetical protein GCM10027060_08450 [Nesterenkonia halophila]|uniref:hypothetical protein n=1 Tax=Nesterenkonia halophila TaxID=302044 RepID=UPI001291CF40|nr:hypothetical protein [Nesterenkonia halophila]
MATTYAELFTVADLDDPDTVESSATALKTATADVDESIGRASRIWGGLEQSYRAPETGELLTALQPATSRAAELARAGAEAETAVHTYAAALREMQTTRRGLVEDIEAFQVEGAEDAAEDDWAAREERIAELQRRCRELAEWKDEAQNACAAALGAITTSASLPRGSRTEVSTADAAGQVETPPQSPEDWLVASLGVTPGENFDGSWADELSFAASKGLTTTGAVADSLKHSWSEVRPRQGWAPEWAKNIAARGERSTELVKKVTGWDANQVTNSGRWLAKNSAQNPYRRPQGLVDGAKALRSRFFANFNTNNLTPKAGKSGAFSTASKVSKVAGGTGSVLTLATGFVGQWNEDSAKHPDMEGAEQFTRAATVGGGAAIGGWAGAKAGAAAGAAIGSLFPGPGTAIGAVAGGVIGGIAGSAVGKELGEGLKNATGDVVSGLLDTGEAVASAAADKAEETWDSVTSWF